jgi:hypothetical protein
MLFGKKKEIKEEKTIKDKEKELEKMKLELEKDKKFQQQKKQIEEQDEVDDYDQDGISDTDNNSDIELITDKIYAIEESEGVDMAFSVLDQLKNNLILKTIMDRINGEQPPMPDDDEKDTDIEDKELNLQDD